MNKILTVVIPTYNIEKYIETCLNSFVIPEVMEKLEVLVVNDGSKDSSAVLARAYEERYPDTFRVIDKENGGHGSTINRGFWKLPERILRSWTEMTGWEREPFIRLMECLEQSGSDVVLSNYYWVNDGTRKKKANFRSRFPE